MSGGNKYKYLLVALPTNIALSNEQDEALSAISSAVTSDYGTTFPFPIPEFKIGTLDALVQHADELAKLSTDCEAVVGKIADSLASILEHDQDKIAQQKNVNDKPVDQYLQTFIWNKVKYRADKPLSELIDALRKEIVGLDNDVKSKFQQYNNTKNNHLAAERKQTGTLANKSLVSVVNPKLMVQDSEYIETHLVVVPKSQVKDFHRSYETLCPMIVPRSAIEVDTDSEFTLFAVTTFKKHSSEFVHKCREKRWTPRDFRYKEGGKEEEKKEIEELYQEERKLWGEALRLASTGYSDSVMTWMHVLALRVFVEAVLRYGLPANYAVGIVRSTPKLAKKAKYGLDTNYMYLGGNAVSRDKKGRVTKDDSAMASEMQAAGHTEGEYTPYVYFEFEMH